MFPNANMIWRSNTFSSSIQKHPENNSQAYFELGKILHQQNRLAEARERLLVSVKQSPDAAGILTSARRCLPGSGSR